MPARVAIQPDGKIVAAGYSDAGGNRDFALVRYNADGSLDTTFGGGGKVLTDFGAASDDDAVRVALQPDGKIVVAGYSERPRHCDFALVRYNADGSLDPSFGAGGKVLTDLGDSSDDDGRAVAIQPDGKIVAAGSATTAAATTTSRSPATTPTAASTRASAAAARC